MGRCIWCVCGNDCIAAASQVNLDSQLIIRDSSKVIVLLSPSQHLPSQANSNLLKQYESGVNSYTVNPSSQAILNTKIYLATGTWHIRLPHQKNQKTFNRSLTIEFNEIFFVGQLAERN